MPALLKDPGFIAPRFPFIIDTFIKDSPARLAGLKTGDKIIQLNDNKIEFFDEFKTEIVKHKNSPVAIGVLRGNDTIRVKVTVPSTGLVGIGPVLNLEKFFTLKHLEYGFFAAIPAGIQKGYGKMTDYLKQFKLLFNRKTKAY